MAELTTIEKAKLALRVVTDVYDADIGDLIDAAEQDLGIAGVIVPSALDAIVTRAIITYVKMHFGAYEEDAYDRLKASYDEQKAQLATATGYTDWLGGDDA